MSSIAVACTQINTFLPHSSELYLYFKHALYNCRMHRLWGKEHQSCQREEKCSAGKRCVCRGDLYTVTRICMVNERASIRVTKIASHFTLIKWLSTWQQIILTNTKWRAFLEYRILVFYLKGTFLLLVSSISSAIFYINDSIQKILALLISYKNYAHLK